MMILLALAAPVAGQPETVRPTLVRVVGPNAEPLVGARVLFVAAPFPALAARFESRLIEATTKAKGRVRVRLDPSLVWHAWAVQDMADGARLASAVVGPVSPGRPLRLTAKPFGVPTVRVVGLAQWRKLAGPLAMTFSSAVAPFPVFRAALPQGDEPVMRIPPLPRGNYFPVLVDAAGGMLDARFFSPEFVTDNPPEQLYERKVPLKRIVLGKPMMLVWKIVDAGKKPVPSARIRVNPSYDSLQHERVVTADAEGVCRFVVPARDQSALGWFDLNVRCEATGFVPVIIRMAEPPKQASRTVELRRGQAVACTVEDPKLPYYLEYGARFRNDAPPMYPALMKLTPAGDALSLPGATDPRSGVPWRIFTVLDGRPVLLYQQAVGHVPRRLELGLSKLARIVLRVTHGDGRAVRGGTVRVHGLTHAIGPRGRTELELPAGPYDLLIVNKRLGDALVRVDAVASKPQEVACPLTAFRSIHGRVMSDGKPRPGAAVNMVCMAPKVTAVAFSQWLETSAVSDDAGRFVFRVSRLAQSVQLHASFTDGKVWYSGAADVKPDSPQEIQIELTR